MTLDEIKSLLEQGTIEEIVQKMEIEKADEFMKNIYQIARGVEQFVGGSTHYNYSSFDLEKKEIHGWSEHFTTVDGEIEPNYGSEDILGFREAEDLVRRKIEEVKARAVR